MISASSNKLSLHLWVTKNLPPILNLRESNFETSAFMEEKKLAYVTKFFCTCMLYSNLCFLCTSHILELMHVCHPWTKNTLSLKTVSAFLGNSHSQTLFVAKRNMAKYLSKNETIKIYFGRTQDRGKKSDQSKRMNDMGRCCHQWR